MHRFVPAPELADVVRRYWLPVWDLPKGQTTTQRVLQYPVVVLVVTADYAQCVGPTLGMSTKELSGRGWAVGAMCQPGTGSLITGRPVSEVTDRVVGLSEVLGLPGARLAAEIRATMAEDPADPEAQAQAVAHLESAMNSLLPMDEEGLLVNAIVEHVETDTTVHRVSQVAEKFGLTERSLQRLCARRIGLTPKWLVQRRRLHEAAELLRVAGTPVLARIAADLGYADQAHFTRDFRRVTGLTPGEFAAEPRTSQG